MKRLLVSARNFALSTGLVAVLGSLGCGSSAGGAHAGSISIVDPNAAGTQLTTLAINAQARVSMTPVGDTTNAGVDWTVLCGGNPLNGSLTGNACGTFSPAHTSDGASTIYTAPAIIPLGTNVTIAATVTSNPASSSSVVVPVVTLPISVVFMSQPVSVATGASTLLLADALNDTSGTGVAFTIACAATPASACGSFTNVALNSALYIAPAAVPQGGSVTVTATSKAVPAQSASVTFTITSTASSSAISVRISPSSFYVSLTGSTHTFRNLIPTVVDDSAKAGVTWKATCGTPAVTCGNITQAATASGATVTYQGPNAIPSPPTVTITATSVTDPTKSASTIATVTSTPPIAVAINPAAPTALPEGTRANLTAVVTNDPNNHNVIWSASCGDSATGACGSFNPDQTASGMSTSYTAPAAPPAGGTVLITAASTATTPANPAVASITINTPTPTIAFTQAPAASAETNSKLSIAAAVTNDLTPGGVRWSVRCASTVVGACGYIAPPQTADNASATYVAPPSASASPVTIIATSIAYPSLTVSSAPITIVPSTTVAINFVPFAPTQLTSYATVNFNATVNHDATSGGVDWQVCANGCGFFTVVPGIAAIPATTTSPFVPAVAAVTATTVLGWPNGLPIPFTAPLATSPQQTIMLSASAHASPGAVATTSITITNSITGPSLTGVVQAGTRPVAGASVALYAAGTNGYASASTLLSAPGGNAYVTSGSSGTFSLPGGYTCPSAGSQVYLVASGGTTGSSAANPNLRLMTALGPCSSLGSTPVVINEVTTVGSVWPLAPFAANDPLTGSTSYLNLGTSSSNTTGLANAFTAVNNLVNISTGLPQFTSTAGNGTVPYPEINTLADMLNSCTSTSGGVYQDGTACGTLFAKTAPLGLAGRYSGTVPTDTLQAAFNLAQHPANAFGYTTDAAGLISLASAASPFQPVLTAVQNDWSISINYAAAGGVSAAGSASFFAVDGVGNLWITNTLGNRITQWDTLGAIASATPSFTPPAIAVPGPVAIDANGYVWISAAGGLNKLTNLGTAALGSPYMGGAGGVGIAIDSAQNIWVPGTASVSKFDNLGTPLSPPAGFVVDGVSNINSIAIDDANDVWIGNASSPTTALNFADLNDVSGQLIVNTPVDGDFDFTQQQFVLDALGNIWEPTDGSQLCELPAYKGLGTLQIANCTPGGPGGVGASGLNSLYDSHGIALDGAGELWIGNAGGNSVPANLSEINLQNFSGTNLSNSFAGFNSSTLAVGPISVAVDASGNVWVLLADNTITEYVGLATPAITPMALAIKTKKLGAKP